MAYLTKEENEILHRAKMKVRALNHPLRQKMLSLIKKNQNRMNVTDIYVKLRIEQSVASQHLAILRKAGIVLPQRDGKFIYYRLNKDRLNQIAQLVGDLAG